MIPKSDKDLTTEQRAIASELKTYGPTLEYKKQSARFTQKVNDLLYTVITDLTGQNIPKRFSNQVKVGVYYLDNDSEFVDPVVYSSVTVFLAGLAKTVNR